MGQTVTLSITNDNRDRILALEQEAAIKALTMCGLSAERHAKEIITEKKAVDTGLLRNSITFALAGDSANIKNYKAERASKYSKSKKKKSGSYSGKMPKAKKGYAVYVGTNVEYAPYIEYGTGKGSSIGGQQTMAGHSPRPFLKPAVADYKDEYLQIIHDVMDKQQTD